MRILLKYFFIVLICFILSGCFTNCRNLDDSIFQNISPVEVPKELSVAIHFYSRSGNTNKIARVIAHSLQLEAVSVTDIDTINNDIDIIFLRAATYKNDVDKNVKQYINNLDSDKIKNVVVFSTDEKNSAYPIIKTLLDEKNITVYDKNYFCLGNIFFENIGYHDKQDLENVALFAEDIIREPLKTLVKNKVW